MRELRSEPTIPDEQGLLEGVRRAVDLYLNEYDLAHAVGETGVIKVTLNVFLDHGRARHATGAAFFERRVDLGGKRG